jgi:hypothetical protein
MKILAALALALLVVTPLARADSLESVETIHAQLSEANQAKAGRWQKVYRWSVAALASGAANDAISSWGKYEANPLLRNTTGRFSGRGLAIKSGITVGSLIGTYLLVRRYPDATRTAAIANFATGALLHGTALRNWRMPRDRANLPGN